MKFIPHTTTVAIILAIVLHAHTTAPTAPATCTLAQVDHIEETYGPLTDADWDKICGSYE